VKWIAGAGANEGDEEKQILAQQLLGEAVQRYEQMGATRYAQEIRKRLGLQSQAD